MGADSADDDMEDQEDNECNEDGAEEEVDTPPEQDPQDVLKAPADGALTIAGAQTPTTPASNASQVMRQTIRLQELAKSLETLVGSPSSESLSCGAEPSPMSCFGQRVAAEHDRLSMDCHGRGVDLALCMFSWRVAAWDLPDVYPYEGDGAAQRNEDLLADAFLAEEAGLECLMRMPLLPASGTRSAVNVGAVGQTNLWSVVGEIAEVVPGQMSLTAERIVVR
jgi:hypothetical protein